MIPVTIQNFVLKYRTSCRRTIRQLIIVYTPIVVLGFSIGLAYGKTLEKEGVAIPKYLYHWTRYERLAEIAGNRRQVHRWNEFHTSRQSLFTERYRGSGDNHLYTWSNPITGMMAQRNEIYGEALIELEIKVHPSRVLIIDTAKTNTRTFDYSKFDLVFYKNAKYQEWIILEPRIVANFTADPDILTDQLTAWSKKMADPSFRFSREDVHSEVFNDSDKTIREQARWQAKTTIDDFLSNRSLIPPYFLRDREGNRTFEKWQTGNQLMPSIKAWRNNPVLAENNFRKNDYRYWIRHFDRVKDEYSIESILSEFQYRMNVATEFRAEQELKTLIDGVNRAMSYRTLTSPISELKKFRGDWLSEKITLSDLLRQAESIHSGTDRESVNLFIEAVELQEQKLSKEMKWTLTGKPKFRALRCSQIFQAVSI